MTHTDSFSVQVLLPPEPRRWHQPWIDFVKDPHCQSIQRINSQTLGIKCNGCASSGWTFWVSIRHNHNHRRSHGRITYNDSHSRRYLKDDHSRCADRKANDAVTVVCRWIWSVTHTGGKHQLLVVGQTAAGDHSTKGSHTGRSSKAF